ncbi:helix-turn-helix domain-containing protein [Mycolicibacterium wolinskyi]|uniref:helix-turn-helix domain-containing protein n=1 Tax=Mycolicibacterium wolinskyi TaxID=59750 RepID=UPI000DA17497|nr:helix-turn-helix domain-containing protein [Mycolicibacterium wolinskyi]
MSRAKTNAVVPRKYVTINEAADYLSVHPNSIRNWIESGKLTGYRLPSVGPRGAVLWRLDLHELDQIIAATATR